MLFLMLILAPTTDGKTYLQRTWEHIDINHADSIPELQVSLTPL